MFFIVIYILMVFNFVVMHVPSSCILVLNRGAIENFIRSQALRHVIPEPIILFSKV